MISEIDVAVVFNDECIEDLAQLAKIPLSEANRVAFAEGVRVAARILIKEWSEPSLARQRKEIKDLHSAARSASENAGQKLGGQSFTKVAKLLVELSQVSRERLCDRGRRPSWKFANGGLEVSLPSPDALGDADQRVRACELIADLTHTGGGYVEGRRRPRASGGHYRSLEWRPFFYAPDARRNFPKRGAERHCLRLLRIAYMEAVGRHPPRAVQRGLPGPFAKMVQKFFELVGPPHAVDVVELINRLDRKRTKRLLKKAVAPNKP